MPTASEMLRAARSSGGAAPQRPPKATSPSSRMAAMQEEEAALRRQIAEGNQTAARRKALARKATLTSRPGYVPSGTAELPAKYAKPQSDGIRTRALGNAAQDMTGNPLNSAVRRTGVGKKLQKRQQMMNDVMRTTR